MSDIDSLHASEYGNKPEITASAPAVVAILGEHTEPLGGLVLSVALSYDVRVAISRRKDLSLRFFSSDFGERKRTSAGSLKFKKEDRWANYLKAMLESLGPLASNVGLDVTIASEVPIGQGFSASTALCLASSLAFRELFSLRLKNEQLAEEAWKAETVFFERKASLSEFLSSAAPPGNVASVVDRQDDRRRAVPFLSEGLSLLLTDCRVPRINVDQELDARFNDCQTCFRALATKKTRSLRDISIQSLQDAMGQINEQQRRRSLHIVEECQRVLNAEQALINGDYRSLGRTVNESHASLRNNYEISCPEIDWLTKRAGEIEAVYFSRLSGRGFGGCTVSLLETSAIPGYKAKIEDYERIFGFSPIIFSPGPSQGLRLISQE